MLGDLCEALSLLGEIHPNLSNMLDKEKNTRCIILDEYTCRGEKEAK